MKNDIELMPITEEWLIDRGFYQTVENAGRLPCFKKGDITIARWFENKWQVWNKTVDITNSPQTIHGFCDLYFKITGKKLINN